MSRFKKTNNLIGNIHTRRSTDSAEFNKIFKDIYDKLDMLLADEPLSLNNGEEVQIATTTMAPQTNGANALAVFHQGEWWVDTNSNFIRATDKSLRPIKGVHGLTGLPTKYEAIKYDAERLVNIKGLDGTQVTMKSEGGTLKVRDKNDANDSDVRASRYKFDTGSTFSSLGLGEIFYSHTNNLVGVSANLNIITSVDVVNSSARLEMDALRGDAHIRFKESTVSKWNLGYDYKSNRTVVTDATCDTTNESTTVTFDNGGTADTTSIDGAGVSGSGITTGTYVVSKNASDNTLILSEPATATASNVTLTFDTTTDERFKINSGAFFNGYSTFNLDSNAALELCGTSSSLKLSYNANDSCTISTGANGATTITTVDGDAALANLTLIADGSMLFGSTTGKFRFYDSDNASVYTDVSVEGSTGAYKIDSTDEIILDSHTGKVKFYDAGDTDDYFIISTVGGTGATSLKTVSEHADGHISIVSDGHVEFDNCGVGFDLVAPTYFPNDTNVLFTTGNKQFATFGSGNITDLNLVFPATSGNFVLLLKQDGTGSRIVTNYKVWYLADGVAASGSATVKFAGGSNPTLTTDANHVDILSFFWDADNQIAYGVATLDFQF
tara:strand:- start:68 stop:1903 length:1836 start_codon:yes stop_codon:yes gene_type:complete